MRWIESGSFMMGSTKDEPSRWDRVPHQVTLTWGYWLFDTPVTQELYVLVSGENPSQFKSVRHPVEQVSWEKARQFIQELNKNVLGLNLSLPTEAQWEFACRVGSAMIPNTEAIENKAKHNATEIDETTHYSGNSNEVFDLDSNRYNDSERKEMHFQHTQVPTRNVAQKKANARGLFDMLGNVWEWCDDCESAYTKAPDDDPLGTQQNVTSLVLRGGSDDCFERLVLGGYRSTYLPDSMDYDPGFRCARVEESETGQNAEPAETLLYRVPEHQSPASRKSEAQLLDVSDLVTNKSIEWPQLRKFVIHSDLEKIHLQQFTKPAWANAIGRDQYGLWASFQVETEHDTIVKQTMRWISPGQFLMGSPENEPERRDNEGPQHEVILTQGYWLFDTPVTQALYEAVTGDNPSHFKSAQSPVESLSWKHAQQFIQQLNKKTNGLNLSLPTEAQWEYACRAGTTTATYAGVMDILGQHNAPVLDAIAWYGGNSGVDFDRDNGYDSSNWKQKQYNHTQAGTRIVALKQANDRGLYDMLGNVLEWCSDTQREYQIEEAIDPVEENKDGASRVLRGGSWDDCAWFVRCAFRCAFPPEDAHYFTGFRCARVQEPGTGQEAESAWTLLCHVAEQRSAASRTSEARLLDVSDLTTSKSIDWPQLEQFVIHSDVEKIHLQQFTKPAWANAIGRDQYGLWASFQVATEHDTIQSLYKPCAGFHRVGF
jgi:formylglycine-generating enzyme required for sulfatase activity